MLKCGGLLETRKIAAMAEVYGIPIAPHGVATQLGKMAMSHICAATPNFKIQEWSMREYGARSPNRSNTATALCTSLRSPASASNSSRK